MSNFILTQSQLSEIIGKNPYVNYWHNAMERLLPDYDINTPQRVAAFVAQCAHESGNFKFLKENLNYKWQTLRKIFPKYFPTDELAQQYASRSNRQEAIANRVYASRMGNGDESSGDGFRYCGRGLIQLTGKNNYQLFANFLGIPVQDASEYILTFEGAVKSACWFWNRNNLNSLADRGDIAKMTRIINGGDKGLEDRVMRYRNALKVLSGAANV